MKAERERRGLLTADQMAKRLGVSGSALREWAKMGIVPSIGDGQARPGSARLFDPVAVDERLRGPVPGPVPVAVIAAECGLPPASVNQLGRQGVIPTVIVDGVMLYNRATAILAIERRKTHKRCPSCERDLPVVSFNMGRGRSRVLSAGRCRECSANANRERRRMLAEVTGRTYRTRVDMDRERRDREAARRAEIARRLEERSRRSAERRAERLRRGKTLTPEQLRRAVARQRERYNTDPEYQARIKAKKIRRKRAMAGTTVEPVNREIVAERDGWRCCICGGKVTRRDWSLDHIVPLVKGGEHTYANVALAHRGCNSARGVDRKPAQAPLFAKVA